MRIPTGPLAALLLAALAPVLQAESFELYIDADYSVNTEAAEAIELGVATALQSLDDSLPGITLDIVPLDHRGNSKRSHGTMQRYLASDRALAIIGGMHSPPYLTYREFINENRILTLLPWSAAGPITRPEPGGENWIFRLSVDDTVSGGFLVREAVDDGACARVALILLETGWGRANHATLTEELARRDVVPAIVEFFPSTIGRASARMLAEQVARSGAECAILLANAGNGAVIAQALHERLQGFRLFSHWGITGGDFAENVPHDVRSALRITVLQTCGLRREQEGGAALREALSRAGGLERLSDIPGQVGFVHGHDLTLLLIAAIEQAADSPDWAGSDIVRRRRAVHRSLEHLQRPVEGILGRYRRPFGPYSAEHPDAHEALGARDLCTSRFDQDGRLEHAE